MTRTHTSVVAGLTCAAILWAASPASAQAVAPALGSLGTYGVVSSTYTNSNTPPQTIINGIPAQPVVCYTTPPVTQPVTITSTELTPCPASTGTDELTSISTLLTGQTTCTSLGAAVALDSAPGHPTGVYTPGCYSSTGAMSVTLGTTVTLNGNGIYVFRSGGAITTGANSLVTVAGGACESDVYWTAVGATTVGANAALSVTPTFIGTILDNAGITIGHFATLTGRALAFAGTVTTDANTINLPTCAAFTGPGGSVPMLPNVFFVLLALGLAGAGYFRLRRGFRTT